MSLKYCLVDNKLTVDEDDCMARVQDVETVGIDELTAQITGRGMSLTDTVVNSVLTELSYAINAELQKGNAVSTPFVKISPSIAGVFDSGDDSFDASRHAVRLNASLGNGIEVDAAAMKTQKVAPETNLPEITAVKDYQTQRTDEVLTRNAAVELKGYDMKIDPADPEQGIFIVNQGQELRAELYMLNKPSHIIFMVPQDAPGGEVQLVLRNKYRSGATVKTSYFDKTLVLQ